ncbi:helix-turn-helix domain-containing protein [Streptomyces ipomoeae]|uniref:AraC-like ligand-binding domain-containing protein n=1 Tax=Streptomyces ipomoeae TaxID=103232 RepID=UPI001FD2404C|nr:helix-turn-helix domain-containing protein [Streptomyces ipomoeae]MDX2937353.1 helix-turn-helix domain-containing protein [Streptomyces ipomoeae]
MILTSVTTDDLPRADRFGWWHDFTASALLPTVLHSDHEDDFAATADVLDLGAAQITAMTYRPVTAARTPRLIRQSDPEYCQLSLTVHGEMRLSQAGRTVAFGAGDLMLYDSSQPFEGRATVRETKVGRDGSGGRAGDVARSGSAGRGGDMARGGGVGRGGDMAGVGSVAHIVAQIPKALLPVRPCALDRLYATPIPVDDGFGDLLAQFLTQVTDKADHYRPTDAPRLLTVLTDLLSGALAHRLEGADALPPESHRHALFLRIQGFIRRSLADPDLSVDAIASAHHISVRSLHRLFQQQGASVATWIRGQRLAGCGRDLADPAKRHVPIQAIAARWGYPRPADFTRAFRTHHGITPSDYRQRMLASITAEN